VCAEGDERVEERCNTVVETNTIYSGYSHARARSGFDRVDKSLDRRCVVAGQRMRSFEPR